MRRRTLVLFALIAVVVVIGIAAALRWLSATGESLADEQQAPAGWSGPVRPNHGGMAVQPMAVGDMGLSWPDRRDAAMGAIDITRLGLQPDNQIHWYIELAAAPPKAAGLGRDELIAYGLVLETTGDGVADYVVGIDNDAPEAGSFHVWVTDLATGDTVEQVGAPYGFPVEFSHPDERQPGDRPGPATMIFTFLSGSRPDNLSGRSMRFYAWASFTKNGEVVAWDYAPDTAWLAAPLGTEP